MLLHTVLPFSLLHISGTTSNQKQERKLFSGFSQVPFECRLLNTKALFQTASGTSSQHGDCGADLFGKVL